MTKNRIVKYATNTALLAVLAAAGIGAYQLGTSKPEENIQEEQEFVEMEQSTEEEPMVDVGTTEVEADMENTSGDLAGTEMEDGANGNEEEPLQLVGRNRCGGKRSAAGGWNFCSIRRKYSNRCSGRRSRSPGTEFFGRNTNGMAGKWKYPA